ncbi:hypothetical protein IQ07DRAFT_582633 [Pyrenochaeta sp. DS3sAY3a]|nr:hypothetical protein IQ07DRAFT_582633 [Pyrenochaeta sp. DS3sAY3a]
MTFSTLVVDERNFPPLPSQIFGSDGCDVQRAAKPKQFVATIIDLPNELISEILDYLSKDGIRFEISALVSLSSTNRRFNRVVTDRLYATYYSQFCQPYLFLRSIISNPYLATLVRNVEISPSPVAHKRYAPTAQDKKIIKEGFRRLGIPDWKTWASVCNTTGLDNTLYSAILVHAPKITSLIQKGKGVHLHGPKAESLNRRITSFENTHAFQYLQTVEIQAVQLKFDHVLPFLCLQSLRRLVIVGLSVSGPRQLINALQRVLPSSSNNIEELSLDYFCLHKAVFKALISSSKRLKSLKYNGYIARLLRHDDIQSERVTSGWETFSAVLRPQIKSLESLDIAIPYSSLEKERGPVHFHKDLSDFVGLKHLKCPLNLIMETSTDAPINFFENLPPSLLTVDTYITSWVDHEAHLKALEQVAYGERGPMSLKKAQIRVSYHVTSGLDWGNLIQPLSDVGVELIVVKQSKWTTISHTESETEAESTDSSSHSSDEVSLYSNGEGS